MKYIFLEIKLSEKFFEWRRFTCTRSFTFTGDEIKDMQGDTDWEFVNVGEQVCVYLVACMLLWGRTIIFGSLYVIVRENYIINCYEWLILKWSAFIVHMHVMYFYATVRLCVYETLRQNNTQIILL